MLISASRRTDLPAFHAAWFLERVRAGWCDVANPVRSSQVTRVSLRPEDVTAIVFWTRDAAPLLPHLPELDARGYRYYWQYTLTGYPRVLEAHTPAVVEAVATMRRLADQIGPARVIWRYDPIVLTVATPPAWHAENFARLAEALRGTTERVVVSLFDEYRWMAPRLRRLANKGYALLDHAPECEDVAGLLRALAATAHACGMEIAACAEPVDLSTFGIAPGKCIDDALLHRLFGIAAPKAKDASQRPACGCVASRDIGWYDSCSHGCVYCYANRRRPEFTATR